MKKNKILFVIILCIYILISKEVFAIMLDDVEQGEFNPNASSNTVVSRDYEYMVASGGVYIITYKGNAETLSIPTSIDGHIVLGLYSECFGMTNKLKKVVIPSTVNAIYVDTFFNCRSLETIEVASNNLTYASYDGCLYSKDYKFFVSCPEGKKGKVNIKNGTQYICDRSFMNAQSITSIVIPASVFDIGLEAFYETSSLSSFNVSSSNSSFIYYDGILYTKDKSEIIKCVDTRRNAVNIDKKVKKIREYAFFNCKNLLGPINLPNGLETIGQGAFSNCNSLTGDIVIPSSVVTLESKAFYECSKISSLDIQASIDVIPEDCFECCKGLKEIIIPNNIKEIGERAFFECENVQRVVLGSNLSVIDNWAFGYLNALKGDLIIPDSVTVLGDAAFGESPNIDGYIIIGSKVKNIGSSVFWQSNKSKGIIFKGNAPTTSKYSFSTLNIPFYCQEGKIGFAEALNGKQISYYAEKPVIEYSVNDKIYKRIVQPTYGMVASEIVTPNFNNYVFEGWYYDKQFVKKYNSSDIIMNNTTLYAKMSVNNKLTFLDNNVIIETGNTKKLNLEYILEDNATYDDITWESSNTNVATVDDSGNVTGLAKGEVTITARFKEAVATTTVIIFQDETTISFIDDQKRVVIGNEATLDLNYHLINNGTFEDIVWESSDRDVADISNGVVSAIKEGTAVITASYGDVSDTIEILVVKKNRLDITTEDFIIKAGRTKRIDVDYYFNDEASLESIEWQSSNTNVAKVTDGVVETISAGEAVITARYANVLDYVKVTVLPGDILSFNENTIYIENTRKTYDIEYYFYSYDHTEDEILWSSSNEAVATIDQGILTIKSNGNALITASVGDTTSSVMISVVNPSSIVFLDDTYTLEYRQGVEANFNIQYFFSDGATKDDIIYTSDDTNVVKVVNNKVVPVGIGKTIVTASYKDARDTIEVNVVSIDKLEFKRMGYIIGVGSRKTIEYIFDSYLGDSENIKFTSSNNKVLKIENQEIIGVSKGIAKIQARYGNISVEISVAVADKDYLLGDVNKDGVVTALDAALVLDMYKNNNGTDEQKLISDVDFNGVVDALDAAIILDIYKNQK